MHRDQWLYGHYPFPGEYEAIINTMWALTPFTAENGATRYVPDSHKLPEMTKFSRHKNRNRLDYAMNSEPETARFRPESTIPILLDPGSMVIWSGKLYHCGGENKSQETRWGMNIGYTRGWIRQEENQYLSFTPDLLKEIDDDMARLLGFSRSTYGHGWADDMRDPLDVARGRTGHQGFGDPVSAPNKLGHV